MADNNINIDFKNDAIGELNGASTTKKIVKMSSARIHAVKINNIRLEKNMYEKKSVFRTNNLINSKVKSLAIFVNEHIPISLKDKFPKYVLTVNGEDFNIIPININRNGIKIIKMSESDNTSDYVHYINQEIASAYLTVTIETNSQDETPFLSNLKILIGDKNNV